MTPTNPRQRVLDECKREKKLSIATYLMELVKKHRKIDEEIMVMQRHPSVPASAIVEKKKEKLKLKEKIARLTNPEGGSAESSDENNVVGTDAKESPEDPGLLLAVE